MKRKLTVICLLGVAELGLRTWGKNAFRILESSAAYGHLGHLRTSLKNSGEFAGENLRNT